MGDRVGDGAVTLAEIRVYPLKGARGLSVRSWRVDRFGPTLDRRWMVVDEKGGYLSQRSHPRLALVRPELDDGRPVLSAPGLSPLCLAPAPQGSDDVEVTVWGGCCRAADMGQESAQWISEFLGEAARLVFMPESSVRPVKGSPDSRVSFSDGYPFLLVSSEAVDELNRRLDASLSVDRFRPNVVVSGGAPHGEDRWRKIRIGEIEFEVVKPCPRCSVTTVDQNTGEKGVEPLRTLSRYRRVGGKVYFGQNLVHGGPGVLEVGQRVEVVEEGLPRPDLD